MRLPIVLKNGDTIPNVESLPSIVSKNLIEKGGGINRKETRWLRQVLSGIQGRVGIQRSKTGYSAIRTEEGVEVRGL